MHFNLGKVKKMNIKKLIIAALSSVMITSSAAFADGHIMYTVSADNVSEHSSKLTPGMLNMFSAYPDTFRMDVYEDGGNCTIAPDIAAISQTNGTMINDNEGALKLIVPDTRESHFGKLIQKILLVS